MRLIPSSLVGRLLLAACLFVGLALAGAAVLTQLVLDRFLHRQIDAQLDSQVTALRAALVVGANGALHLRRDMDGAPFDRPGSGWYWRITGGDATLSSASLQNRMLRLPEGPERAPPPPPPPQPGGHPPAPPPPGAVQSPPMAADGEGPGAQPLHFRFARFTAAGRAITVMASAPEQAVKGPLREAMTAVWLSLGIAALALIGALYLQVLLGLRPLGRLRRAVADVRAGALTALPENQPREIAPLAEEMNRLIAENRASLTRARRHVANLAHGLKTPLANLAIALEDATANRDGELGAMVTLMDRRVQHHLRRARLAAIDGPARASTRLAVHAEDLAAVFRKIHADRAITIAIAIDDELTVACEAQDLDEMLGNLMDNACKWARSHVRVTAQTQDGQIAVAVEDDGPGLAPVQRDAMLMAGRRLDESAPGHGFGLPITLELSELYGGSLELTSSGLGGLKALLMLPAVG